MSKDSVMVTAMFLACSAEAAQALQKSVPDLSKADSKIRGRLLIQIRLGCQERHPQSPHCSPVRKPKEQLEVSIQL